MHGFTVLHRAIESDNLELIHWLIEQGADVNAKDKSGASVLNYAAESRNLKLVKWLREHGAK